MSLLEVVMSAADMRMESEDGEIEHLKLSGPMSASELEDLERQLPCALPSDVRDLLMFSKGFENGPLESFQFGGIWRDNPGATRADLLRSDQDPDIRSFAESLSDSYFIVDLRSQSMGSGFSWGRFGPKTNVVRYQNELLFAYESKSRLQRFLGR